MKKIINLFILFMIIGFSGAIAQDKIYKKGGEVLEVKITEIGVDEIKYRLFNDKDGPTYTVEKDRIVKIVYQNGRVETFTSSFNDAELYADQKKQALKINFLSPLLGYTALSYERSVKPGRSYEATLGIIGLGKRQEIGSDYNSTTRISTPVYRGQTGAYIGAGYKFIKLPDFTSRGAKFSHVMQGTYIKPEVMFGVFGSTQYSYTNSNTGRRSNYTNRTTAFGGVILNLGKQWVFSDVFLLDIYGGLGYNINNNKDVFTTSNGETTSIEFNGYHYGMVSTEAGSGVGLTGGIRIGILIGKKQPESN
jgi:hypothetical protein